MLSRVSYNLSVLENVMPFEMCILPSIKILRHWSNIKQTWKCILIQTTKIHFHRKMLHPQRMLLPSLIEKRNKNYYWPTLTTVFRGSYTRSSFKKCLCLCWSGLSGYSRIFEGRLRLKTGRPEWPDAFVTETL